MKGPYDRRGELWWPGQVKDVLAPSYRETIDSMWWILPLGMHRQSEGNTFPANRVEM